MVMDVDEYDRLPCRIADRYRDCHGKYAKIVSVCAVPYDISLVAFTLEYQSPYEYGQPDVTITRVGNVTGAWSPPFVSGATGQAQIPFLSLTHRKQQDFIYDVGAVVPNYITSPELDYTFISDGSGSVYTAGVDTISLGGTWNKGLYFQPLRYQALSNGRYMLYYQAVSNTNCPCKIWCELPSGRTYSGIVDAGPPDICRTREVPIYLDELSGNALHGELGFQFDNGQEAKFEFYFLGDMEPEAPEVSEWDEGARLRIPWKDKYHNDFSGAYVRVERYKGTPSNVQILQDWTPPPLAYVYDFPLEPEITYGYRISYIGPLGEPSLASDWVTYTRTFE